MKKIILICNLILIFSISGCSTNQVVDNETIIEENNTESTYDLYVAIKNAKCVTEYPDTATIDDFDTVKFGKYEQDDNLDNGKEDIEWVILEKQEKKAFLLSKYILENLRYDDNFEDTVIEKDKLEIWKNSSLQKWLNNTFIDNFKNKEIIKVDERTNDKFVILTKEDIDKYFSNIIEKSATKGTIYLNNGENTIEHYYIYIDYDQIGNLSDVGEDYYADTKETFDKKYEKILGNGSFLLNEPYAIKYGNKYCYYVNYIKYDGTISTGGWMIDCPYFGIRPAVWVKNN